MKKNMFLNLIFIIIVFVNSTFAAEEREILTISDTNWTLIELDPASDGYVRFTIDQININRTGTQWSPINTITTTTSVLKQGEQEFYRNIYVKNANATASNPVYLSITRDSSRTSADTYAHDGYGNKIKSFDGALNIHDPHSHHVVINELFHQHTAVTTTLAANAPAGSTQIALTSATGFVVGDYLHIQDGVIETIHPKITALVGNVATLDHPLDNSFVIGDSVTKTIESMDVIGSLASPQSFKAHPPAGQVWHIETLTIQMTHGSAGDNGLFGNLTSLTNGVVLRRYDGATGTFSTLTVWKNNGDIHGDTGNVTYTTRSGGGGSYGTNATGEIYENSGAVVRLDGTAGDYLEALGQDDISALDSFKIKAQGHTEGI